MRLIYTAILFLSSAATNAAAVLIDFDEVTPQYNIGAPTSVTSKGYDFVARTILAGGPPESGVSSAGLFASGDCFAWGPGCGAEITMERSDSAVFSILSLTSSSVDYSGTILGGLGADLSVAIGTGDWLQLVSFRVSSICAGPFSCGEYSAQLDDITVSAVPVPAAVWLFGSALAGLGWMRRKHAA